ncbi:MAG TPA: hypothetical protein VMU49_02830 [Candidatus Acidoferrales bacterium]|nr:hypothetical protein [Candidatus Acidoferrales bacterium]
MPDQVRLAKGPDRMRRLEGEAAKARTCAQCRRFDGLAWCHRWNIATDSGAPICDQFRVRPS